MRNTVAMAELNFVGWNNVVLDGDLVINTTPKGAADDLPSGNGVLFESLYDPWPTTLASKWDGKVIDGLDLLIHQAIDQIHLMTGFVIDRPLMAQLLRAAGEGGDDVKSSWPLWVGLHTCYNVTLLSQHHKPIIISAIPSIIHLL